jgi:preprotein translocase subunit Sec63
MTIILIFIIAWIVITYVKSNILNIKLTNENQHLKDKCERLEVDVRDQANKNIILQSLINQRENK